MKVKDLIKQLETAARGSAEPHEAGVIVGVVRTDGDWFDAHIVKVGLDDHSGKLVVVEVREEGA